ncbi:MAG: arginine--tRNA ligase [Thermodesulfobacteriota bacterium]
MHACETLEKILRGYVAGKGWAWPDKAQVTPTKEEKFGDVATNLALVLAPQAGMKPRDLAADICAAVQQAEPAIAKAEAAGPGFVNVFYAPAFWQATVGEVLAADADYGRGSLGAGRKVQVEYVSANPTGPLHIGHGRGAAVGDSLARILRFAGFEVSTEYYLNDAGRQMNLLGLSVWYRAQQILDRNPAEPEDYYKGDYIKDIAAQVLQDNPFLDARPEPEILDICRQAAQDGILAGIKADLADFRTEHQVWFSELSLVSSGAVDRAFDHLKERGFAYDKDGAFWFETTKLGDDKDRVLRKSDGSLTYFASDIAYHDDKYARGFDLVVDIWGADHHGYVPRMKAAVQALGQPAGALEVILVQLVNLLRGGQPVAMSTRSGEFDTLEQVCAEVGVDAARFMFLSRKSDSHLDFDLELVKQQSMDNPVYYVQYAHARIRSVMRKAEERGAAAGAADAAVLARLETPEDLRLLKMLAQFPDTVAGAAKQLAPHFVSFYLMDLAGSLHRYYTVHQVLGADSPDLVRARLLLMLAVARVLRSGLDLLGVEAPERMERNDRAPEGEDGSPTD